MAHTPGHRPPAAGPQPTHDCPCGCGRQVAHSHYACRPGWYRLPFPLRQAISATYGRDRLAHAEAMKAADDWYRGHIGVRT